MFANSFGDHTLIEPENDGQKAVCMPILQRVRQRVLEIDCNGFNTESNQWEDKPEFPTIFSLCRAHRTSVFPLHSDRGIS